MPLIISLIVLCSIPTLVIYFLPTIVAVSYNNKNTISIFTLNLCLGWTVLCWYLALILALTNESDE